MWGHGWYGMMGDGGSWGGMGRMMIFGGLFWLVLLALVIAGVVWLVQTTRRRGPDEAVLERNYPALEVLEQRYARGEINRNEYLEKKEDMLGGGRPNTAL